MCFSYYDSEVSDHEEVETCDAVHELECEISNIRESAIDLIDCIYDNSAPSPKAISEALLCLCNQLNVRIPQKEQAKEPMSYFDLGVKLSQLSLMQ